MPWFLTHEFPQGFCRHLVCGSTVQVTREASGLSHTSCQCPVAFWRKHSPQAWSFSTHSAQKAVKPELLVWTRQLCRKEKIKDYHRIMEEEHVWRDLKGHLVQPFLPKAQSRQNGPELCLLNLKSVQCWGIHHFPGRGESHPQAISASGCLCPITDWKDAMEKFLYTKILEATPRLELKAVSPISAAPKANVSAAGGEQRPQRLPGHHQAAQNKSH